MLAYPQYAGYPLGNTITCYKVSGLLKIAHKTMLHFLRHMFILNAEYWHERNVIRNYLTRVISSVFGTMSHRIFTYLLWSNFPTQMQTCRTIHIRGGQYSSLSSFSDKIYYRFMFDQIFLIAFYYRCKSSHLKPLEISEKKDHDNGV